MTSLSLAMKAAKALETKRNKDNMTLFIKSGYTSHLMATGNPLTSPNYHQRMFFISVNNQLAKLWSKNAR